MLIYRSDTVCSPGLSKNVITVGATYAPEGEKKDHTYVASYSSRGPSSGRIKPDICMVGTMTSAKSLSKTDCKNSCTNHDDVVSMKGTYPQNVDIFVIPSLHIDGYTISSRCSCHYRSISE